jgi:PmbA protein
MTNKEITSYVLDGLKKIGATSAYCKATKSSKTELNSEHGEFTLLRTTLDSSVAVKALAGSKAGTASTNCTDQSALDELIATCMDSANAAQPDEAQSIAPDQGIHAFEHGIMTFDRDMMFDRLKEFLDYCQDELPQIKLGYSIVEYINIDTHYQNTNGTELSETNGLYGFSCEFSAVEGEKSSSMNGMGVYMLDLDTPFIDLPGVRSALEECVRSIETVSVEGKSELPVIITPHCLEDILGYFLQAIGDVAIIDGTSPYKDKLNSKVASEQLTFRLAPRNPKIANSSYLLSEGFIAENTDVIKDGILKTFDLSLYGANKTGNKILPAGNNFVVEPGEKPLAELVGGIDKGLMVDRVSGGYPGMNGDFTFVAKNSFLIKEGKIADAVNETTINGNIGALLQNVLAVSAETLDNGTHNLPWVAFSGLTISGK